MKRDLRDGTEGSYMQSRRDLRDPQKLGEKLIAEGQYQKKPLAAVYDNNVQHFHIPDVSKDDSMCKIAVEEYAETLKEMNNA